ncbi:MAG: NAD(+)/NADH kinase [Armatimonadetes bacterium]|jgi:NAD+ kinase|nr:NAD(+)/NADH kinase [Armatimonadota bacterium]
MTAAAAGGPVRSLGIIVHEQKPAALALGEELHAWLADRGVPSQIIHLRQESGADEQWRTAEGCPPSGRLFGDALLVLGGDGTLLAASRIAAPAGQPMLSVQLGGFGFLAGCRPERAQACLERVLRGDYRIVERVMLQMVIQGRERAPETHTALNDVVVAKGTTLARLLHLRAYVDDCYVAAYAADGLIVSTPTGSTAYSLSAGGPLVHPDVDVLMLTPICPHALNVRSLVLPAAAEVKLTVENVEDSEVLVTVDGQTGVPLGPEEWVTVSRSAQPARFIDLGEADFFQRLREKLGWGERCR